MQLNETAQRLDGQLDSVTKKIEKIELETRQHREGANESRDGHLKYRHNF